jgi:hypothetical protein
MSRSPHTRRFPRYHVHLPVSIATDDDASTIAVPGLVSEISRTGMEVYGGVQRKPGQVMEVEFASHAADTIRIAGVVRSRAGFCFGVEFLSMTTSRPEQGSAAIQDGVAAADGWRMMLRALNTDSNVNNVAPPPARPERSEETLVELLLDRHENFLREAHTKIDRLRERTLKMREFREEMERLLQDRHNQQ